MTLSVRGGRREELTQEIAKLLDRAVEDTLSNYLQSRKSCCLFQNGCRYALAGERWELVCFCARPLPALLDSHRARLAISIMRKQPGEGRCVSVKDPSHCNVHLSIFSQFRYSGSVNLNAIHACLTYTKQVVVACRQVCGTLKHLRRSNVRTLRITDATKTTSC